MAGRRQPVFLGKHNPTYSAPSGSGAWGSHAGRQSSEVDSVFIPLCCFTSRTSSQNVLLPTRRFQGSDWTAPTLCASPSERNNSPSSVSQNLLITQTKHCQHLRADICTYLPHWTVGDLMQDCHTSLVTSIWQILS